MKWLITGGCGFIGTSLIAHLCQQARDTIRIVDNLSVGTVKDLERVCQYVRIFPADISARTYKSQPPQVVELIEADILDEQTAIQACQGVDIIVHLAANTGVAPSVKDPRQDCLFNVLGTLNYLEAARHNMVKRFIFASSGGTVVGNCKPPIHERLAPHPVAPYGASKLAGEGYCSAYFQTFGVQTIALRFGNVYGVGSTHKNSVVAKFIRQALRGETLEIYGDGHQTRDFIYIEDLIRAIMKAAEVDGIGGEIFQIATSAETTVNELTTALLQAMKSLGLPEPEVRYAPPLPGEVKRNYADTSKAQNELGWQVKTELQTGLKQTIAWFLKNKADF